MECDGGGDHGLRRVFNQIPLLGLFLNGNMENLVSTRGCPRLSYLNIAEREMSLLNIGISVLALTFYPETYDGSFLKF